MKVLSRVQLMFLSPVHDERFFPLGSKVTHLTAKARFHTALSVPVTREVLLVFVAFPALITGEGQGRQG